MNKITLMAICVIFIAGCATRTWEMDAGDPGYKIHGVSVDPTYGYTAENPINVGIFSVSGVRPEYDYLKALRGPNGEALKYRRLGSCCHFETENSPFGGGFLDIWEVSCKGIEGPVHIYLNAYEYEEPKAPMGFTFVGYDRSWSRAQPAGTALYAGLESL